ncbi:hypothetical protein AAG570_014143, partial [Ranatra chinensis]
RDKLEALLKIVHCEVISFSNNDDVDAYVLSESSMFVAQRRFILKTCGTTTPLSCVRPLLQLVKQHAGFSQVEDVFYSRKNFKRPDLQKNPHQSFEQEVLYLNSIFKDGTGYCMGTPGKDCWYLYTLSAPKVLQCNNNNNNNNNNDVTMSVMHEPDQTLEVLMTDLDPKVMAIFTKDLCSSAKEATKKSGIDSIIPEMKIDDYLFEPCGYSMNGLSKNGCYMTIHITPEPEFSYVSFETNIPQATYKDVIDRVLQVFQPGKFVLTVFANKSSLAADFPVEVKKRSSKLKSFGGLECREVQYCRLRNYDLSFALYSKFPS